MFVVKGPILIVGRARSGEAAKELLKLTYPNCEICFFDDDPARSDFKSEREMLARSWSHAILSPGFPSRPFLAELQRSGTELSQELDVAAGFLKREKIYGITGSVGKSTVAWVAYQTLRALGKKVFVGGNFGTPLAQYMCEREQGQVEEVDYLILELSSYQTERMAFMIDRGLILNLHPNHLDRYGRADDYYLAKLRMIDFCREGVWGIKPGGDLYEFAKQRSLDQKIRWVDPNKFVQIFAKSTLMGEHNLANLAALLEFVAADDLDEGRMIDLLAVAQPLPHRQEVFEHAGSIFVNDSKATTTESVLTAHKALRDRYPDERLVWLLGGRDKKLPWEKLKRLWSDKNLEFVFFGEAGAHIQAETGLGGKILPTLRAALAMLVAAKPRPKQIIVLSPGGTSLDEFKSFEERGQFFKTFITENF